MRLEDIQDKRSCGRGDDKTTDGPEGKSDAQTGARGAGGAEERKAGVNDKGEQDWTI